MKRVSVLMLSLVVAFALAIPLAGCSSQEYTPAAKDQTVSDSSLKTEGTLTVGVNASHAPYATESSGSIVGIEVDIAAALADEMGLKLELVDVGTSVANAFDDENVDIVMGVDEAGDGYWLSESYLSSSVAVFAADSAAQAPTAAGDFKVAAQSSSMSAWEVSDHYGDDCLADASSIQEAFQQLADGTVTYAAADSIIGEYVAHSTDIEAYPVALLQEPSTYCIAAASSNTDLQSAISKALTSIVDGGVVNVIEKRWLGETNSISNLSVIIAPQANEEESTDDSSTEDSDDSDSEDQSSTSTTTTTTSTSTSTTTSSSGTTSTN